MPVYYKTVLRGTYQSQNIVNVLYWAPNLGGGAPLWEEAVADDVGATLETTFGTDYTDPLPLTFTWVDIVVSGVDQFGTTVSPYERVIPVNIAGDQDDTTDGAYQAAVLAMQTGIAPGANLNVKRSYIAYGPLTSTWVGNSGLLAAPFATAIAPLLGHLQTPLAGSIDDYYPVRVGRTTAPGPTRIGLVQDATLRPYATIRKSRKLRPTGT